MSIGQFSAKDKPAWISQSIPRDNPAVDKTNLWRKALARIGTARSIFNEKNM